MIDVNLITQKHRDIFDEFCKNFRDARTDLNPIDMDQFLKSEHIYSQYKICEQLDIIASALVYLVEKKDRS